MNTTTHIENAKILTQYIIARFNNNEVTYGQYQDRYDIDDVIIRTNRLHANNKLVNIYYNDKEIYLSRREMGMIADAINDYVDNRFYLHDNNNKLIIAAIKHLD